MPGTRQLALLVKAANDNRPRMHPRTRFVRADGWSCGSTERRYAHDTVESLVRNNLDNKANHGSYGFCARASDQTVLIGNEAS